MTARYEARWKFGRTFCQATLGAVLAGALVVGCGNTAPDDNANASKGGGEAVDQPDEAGQQETSDDRGQDESSPLSNDYDFTAEAEHALGANPKRQVNFHYSDEFAEAYLDEGEAFSFDEFIVVAESVDDEGLCGYQVWVEPSKALAERAEAFQQQRLESARAGEFEDSQGYIDNYSDLTSQEFLEKIYNVNHSTETVKCTTGVMPEDDEMFTVRPAETFDLESGSRSDGAKFMFGVTSDGALVFADSEINGLVLDSYGNWVAE